MMPVSPGPALLLAATAMQAGAVGQVAGAGDPDAADTARVNGQMQARASAQSAAIRQSQEDYARSRAAFARDQAAYEEAKRRNDIERAAAAASAAAYQRDLAAWKATVAEMAAHTDKRRSAARTSDATTATPPVPKMVCTTEMPTGSKLPRRVCRSSVTVAAQQRADQTQAEDYRDRIRAGGGCRSDRTC